MDHSVLSIDMSMMNITQSMGIDDPGEGGGGIVTHNGTHAGGHTLNHTIQEILNLLKLTNDDYENLGVLDDPIPEELMRNILLVFVYSLIVTVSLAGNLLVCKVIYDLKESRTTTNVLIANLAVSDLLMTVLNIPFNIARLLLDNWPFGETLCVLVPFIQSTSAHCSSISMMVIAIERYRSLIHNTHVNGNCYPCQRAGVCTVGYKPFINILILIWSLAAIFSLPHGMYNEVVEMYIFEPLIRCRVIYPEPEHIYRQRLTLVTFLSQYLVPIFLTCVCYLRIGFFLWRKEIVGTHSEFHRLSLLRRKKRRIKMLIVVVLVFAICWLPLQVYHLLTDFDIIKYRSSLFFVVHWFAMSSVCYNPFIYCWLNENFRRKAKTLFTCIPIHTADRPDNNSSVRMDSMCEQHRMSTLNTDVGANEVEVVSNNYQNHVTFSMVTPTDTTTTAQNSQIITEL